MSLVKRKKTTPPTPGYFQQPGFAKYLVQIVILGLDVEMRCSCSFWYQISPDSPLIRQESTQVHYISYAVWPWPCSVTKAVFWDLSCHVTMVTLCELVPSLCDLGIVVWPEPSRMWTNCCEQGWAVCLPPWPCNVTHLPDCTMLLGLFDVSLTTQCDTVCGVIRSMRCDLGCVVRPGLCIVYTIWYYRSHALTVSCCVTLVVQCHLKMAA